MRDTASMADRQLGPWRLLDRLGRGGNAQVWRVEHVDSGELAALKEINARRVDREPYQRFITEIETLRGLGDYPGVLPLIDDHVPKHPSEADGPWLVMPIAQPIRTALAEADLPAVVRAVQRIADTLARLQSEHGLGHRDVKPANLYELAGQALVGDFGLVALPDRSGLTRQGKPLGPANFIPFEMLNAPATADPFAADVYSLAKALWVLACGVDFPPPGHQPASAAPHRIADYCPYPNAERLDELVDASTQLDPRGRPGMARNANDLHAWLGLPAEPRDFAMAEAAAAARGRLSAELGEAERIERWKQAAHAAVRRFDELATPLNVAVKAADPRARVGVVDKLVDQMLRTLLEMGSPEILFHWTRTSLIAAGGPLSYVLRIGRGIELTENGELIIRAMLDLGLDGVMQTDMHWTDEERVVPVGSVQQEAALQGAVAKLGEKLQEGLLMFAGIELAGPPRRGLTAGAGEGELVDVLGGDGGGVELAGVVEAQPPEHLLVFVVVGVGEDAPEVRVSPGAAAVLWRAGALGDDQDRVGDVRVGVEQVFDDDLVLPVVAEVVGVAEASAEVDELAECDLALVAEPELGIGVAELLLAEGEHVHVVVLPAERCLEDLVQVIEAGVGAEMQPPPDRRLGHAEQLDLDLHDDVVGGAVVAHRGSRCAGRRQPTVRRSSDSERPGRSRVSLAGELLVVGDQAGEPSPERERPGVGALAVHRAVLVDRAGDGDEPSGGGVEDDGLPACFELVADDPVADLA